jgi:hypothetical protein
MAADWVTAIPYDAKFLEARAIWISCPLVR